MKERRSKWLIALALLFSLSAFTGYYGKSTVRYRQPVQTAWRYTNHRDTAKRIVSYKKAAAVLNQPGTIHHAGAYAIALLVFNKIMHVKLIGAHRILNTAEAAQYLIRVKVIPGNSMEDAPLL